MWPTLAYLELCVVCVVCVCVCGSKSDLSRQFDRSSFIVQVKPLSDKRRFGAIRKQRPRGVLNKVDSTPYCTCNIGFGAAVT